MAGTSHTVPLPEHFTYKYQILSSSLQVSSMDPIHEAKEAMLSLDGRPEKCRIKSFTDLSEAKNFYDGLMDNNDHRIAKPVCVFKISGNHFVAIPARGYPLALNKYKSLLLDGFERGNVVVSSRISAYYKAILRDLIQVHIRLNFKVILDLSTINVVVDGEVNEHLQILILDLEFSGQDKSAKLQQWPNLDQLIKLINTTHEVDVTKLEFRELTSQLLGGNVTKSIFEIPLFWDPERRCQFICELHLYLESDLTVHFWDTSLDPAVGSTWVEKLKQDSGLESFREQDRDDRRQKNIRRKCSRHWSQEENRLRECIDLMRQTLTHCLRMLQIIRNKNPRIQIKNKFELHLRYESVFPDHMQLFADRVEFLNIRLR